LAGLKDKGNSLHLEVSHNIHEYCLITHRFTAIKKTMIENIVKSIESFKDVKELSAIIPTLRLFAILSEEFHDLLSAKNTKKISGLSEIPLLNFKSYELQAERLEERFNQLLQESTKAIVLELSLEVHSKYTEVKQDAQILLDLLQP
jgi:hypothetical protein